MKPLLGFCQMSFVRKTDTFSDMYLSMRFNEIFHNVTPVFDIFLAPPIKESLQNSLLEEFLARYEMRKAFLKLARKNTRRKIELSALKKLAQFIYAIILQFSTFAVTCCPSRTRAQNSTLRRAS